MIQKPKSLVGFIDYNGVNYPFWFDEGTFTLMLFPPTIDEWKETASISFKQLIESLKPDKSHKWIKPIELRGVTSERNRVIFHVEGGRSSYNGFYSHKVVWYFYYTEKLNPKKIQGFRISGTEVNYFFPPQKVLKPSVQFGDDGKTIQEMSIISGPVISKPCGRYRVAPHTDAQVEVSAYSTIRFFNYTSPIDAASSLKTTFFPPTNLEVLLNAYLYTRCFLKYITYRNNVTISKIDVCSGGNKEQDYNGILVFKARHSPEDHKKAADRIISYSLLGEKTAKLLTVIKNYKIDFQYLCDSIDDTHHYPMSRVIMILTEFEREFHNIYGMDSGRSDTYISVKSDIVSLVEDYVAAQHGKRREYARQLKKYLEARDNSFAFSLKRALLDCEPIMEPFVNRKYNGSYLHNVDELSSRMGIVRNGIAHSRLDFHFQAVHLSDLKVVEELIYAIRLKYSGINARDIQCAINNLFGELIAF